jgi:hypothetical protein
VRVLDPLLNKAPVAIAAAGQGRWISRPARPVADFQLVAVRASADDRGHQHHRGEAPHESPVLECHVSEFDSGRVIMVGLRGSF